MGMIDERSDTAPRAWIEKEALKEVVGAYCCGTLYDEMSSYDENAIIPKLHPVWEAFQRYDFDLNGFMSEKGYDLIEDENLRVEVMMTVFRCLDHHPLSPFMIDWINGHLDFFERENQEITDMEVLHRLYFCSTEEELWKMMAEGIGDIKSLYLWYMGVPNATLEDVGIPCYCQKDEAKAARMLNCLLDDSVCSTEAVRAEAARLKKMWNTPKKQSNE